MSEKSGGRTDRRLSELHPEFVPLGFLVEEPMHGYELYNRFSDGLGGIWHISESQMYSVLKRLEKYGYLKGRLDEGASAASRRILEPTASGRSLFDAWLAKPTVCSPRVLRLEFLTRLFFAQRRDPSCVAGLCAAQREAVARAIERLAAAPSAPSPVIDVFGLARTFRENQLRSVLAWLDGSVSATIGYRLNHEA